MSGCLQSRTGRSRAQAALHARAHGLRCAELPNSKRIHQPGTNGRPLEIFCLGWLQVKEVSAAAHS